ncbi:MAG TPA: hypothetical protein DIU15_05290 [Deltaproteobacteria bacterium]|nr:hypothetical protein [Deltaproteobacteria bacterium]HCP45432.1 hypothetical protein [Deltaproteobacteria bacterium]
MLAQWNFDGLSVSTAAVLASVLVAIAIGLFFLRPRPQLRPVASLLLWQQVLAGRANPLWKELLLLALQVLIILALVGALTDPSHTPLADDESDGRDTEAESAWHRIWVVDTSLSMHAGAQGGPTRMARVRDHLLAELESLPEDVRAGLVGAGQFPSLLTPISRDRSRLALALRLLEPEGGTADLLAALRFAIGQPPVDKEGPPFEPNSAVIELFTDDPLADAIARDFTEATGWRVLTRAPFEALPNLAITAFDLRGTEGIPSEEEGLVRVANHSPFRATAQLTLETQDAVLGEANLSLEPGGELIRRYRFQPPGPDGVEAILRDIQFVGVPAGADGQPAGDGLSQDNHAFAWLQPVRPIQIVLVSPGNRYLDNVLALIPGAQVSRFQPEDYGARARELSEQADLVFFDGWAPPGSQPTRAFYIGPGAMVGAFEAAGSFREPAITDWNHEHPVSQGLRLRDLKVALAVTLKADEGDERLLGSPSGPVALARKGPGDLRAIAWGFDFGASDLPLRVAFPQLVINALLWMREGRAVTEDEALRHPLSENLWFEEAGSTRLAIRDIRADAYGRAAGDNRAVLAATREVPLRRGNQPIQFDRPGLFRLTTDLSQTRVAVNIGETDESNLQRVPMAHSGSVLAPAPEDNAHTPARPPWEWLALFGLLALVVEFGLYTR